MVTLVFRPMLPGRLSLGALSFGNAWHLLLLARSDIIIPGFQSDAILLHLSSVSKVHVLSLTACLNNHEMCFALI